MSPTGYTGALYEGEQSFEDFALTCARAFGALVTLRDEPLNAPIPEDFTASSWHADGLRKAQAELDEVEALTLIECAARARTEYATWDAHRRAANAEAAARVERYRAMRERVLAWHPPTDEHTALRDFMVDQLDRSMDGDGPLGDRFWGEPPAEAIAWRDAQIAKALRDIEYHAKELAAERERARERTEWLRDLRRSLRVEVPA